MRVPDAALNDLEHKGFTVVEDFLTPDELELAQAGLWDVYPRPETYFAEPEAFPEFGRSQFSGIRHFPFPSFSLSRLTFHPDLVDVAERFLGSTDLEIYKIELWAKYSGAIDYTQPHHRDFGNHTLVVPRPDNPYRQLTTFLLLSDVTVNDGPTAVVDLRHTADLPMDLRRAGVTDATPVDDPLLDVEVAVTGRAGTLMMYRTDVMHRATGFVGPNRSRFALLTDFQVRGHSWKGRMAWGNYASQPLWSPTMTQASVRERALFGFPSPGDPYWTSETLEAVGRRYPGMDMAPYGTGVD